MTLADDVDLEVFIMAKDELSGADIKAICTESGLLALRERRMKVRVLRHGVQKKYRRREKISAAAAACVVGWLILAPVVCL